MAPSRIPRLDRGSIAVELAIVAPVAALLLALIVQVVLWSHATHTAQAAAGAALVAARVESGSAGAGQGAAENAFAHYEGGSLEDGAVSVDRGAETVTVTVTGTSQQLIPFIELPVSASVTGPIETFRPDTGAP